MAAISPASYQESGSYKRNELLQPLQSALADRVSAQRTIIGDTYLFWLAFCYAFSFKTYDTEEFSVQKHSAKLRNREARIGEAAAIGEYFPVHLTIEGQDHVVQKIQKVIEELRVFLNRKLQSSQPLRIAAVLIGKNCHLKEQSPLIDYRDWDNCKGIPAKYFDSYVMPLLPLLSRMLGLEMSTIKYEILEVWMSERIIHKKECEIFTIINARSL